MKFTSLIVYIVHYYIQTQTNGYIKLNNIEIN
jgi:hypothetical protein